MPDAPDPAPSPPKPRKRWLPRVRFSLRTLVVLALLAGSAGLFYTHVDAWFVRRTIPGLPNQQEGLVSPDGRYCALSAWRETLDDRIDSHQIRVWDIASGSEVYKREYGVTSHSWGASFRPSSGYLLLYENGQHLIDLQSGKELSPEFDRASFSDGRGEKALLFRNKAESLDAELWDLAVRKCVMHLKLLNHLDDAWLDHEQKHILLTRFETISNLIDETPSSLIWDIARGTSIPVPGRGIESGFSPDDRFVLTWEYPKNSERSAYFVSESATGKLICSFGAHNTPEFSPDGTLLLHDGSGEDESILVNLPTGGELRLRGRQVYHYEHFSGFSPDGRQVFTSTVPSSSAASGNGALLAWDCKSGENLFSIADASHSVVRVFPDANRILAGGKIFDPLKKEVVAHNDGQVATDHRRLLVSGHAYNDKAKSPCIVDMVSGKILFSFPASANGNMCEMDAECSYILTDAPDKNAFLWQRRRPEYWWGVAWLPEFWLTALFAGALGWSVWRDRRPVATKTPVG